MKLEKKVIWLLLLMLPFWSVAQELVYTGDPDVSFFKARNLAFEGNREVARDTLTHILTKYPDYVDVRSLLASTYSWDGEYDEARKHFNRITSVERNHKEVWVAAIKNEIYAENYQIALGLTNKALRYVGNDPEILSLRKAVLIKLEMRNKKHEAKKTIAKDSIEVVPLKNSFELTNAYEIFDIVYDPMIYSSLSFKRETLIGNVIPRVNYSHRFETHGIQYEVDLYPKFSKTFYGYLNYGFSKASTYPAHRVGAELYVNLPKSLEASAGGRFLDFRTGRAMIYTGSLGMYRGNYYYSLRPYITPQYNGNLGFSGNLLVRKYLKDKMNYMGLTMGMGYSPELKQLRDDDELLAETLLFIASQRVHFEYQFTGSKSPNIYKANLGVNRQELIFESGKFFWGVSAGISYQVKF